MKSIPFKYGNFYDYPRDIVFCIGHNQFRLYCYFDQSTDDYNVYYDLYLLVSCTHEAHEGRGSSFDPLLTPVDFVHLGTIPIVEVGLDVTLRRTLDEDAIVQKVRESIYAPFIIEGSDKESNSVPPDEQNDERLHVVSFASMCEYPRDIVVCVDGEHLLFTSPLQANGWTFEDWFDVYRMLPQGTGIPTPHSKQFDRSFIGRIALEQMRFDRTKVKIVAREPISYLLRKMSGTQLAETENVDVSVPWRLVEAGVATEKRFYYIDGRMFERHLLFRHADGSLHSRLIYEYDDSERATAETIVMYDRLGRKATILTTNLLTPFLVREEIAYSIIGGEQVANARLFDALGNQIRKWSANRQGYLTIE